MQDSSSKAEIKLYESNIELIRQWIQSLAFPVRPTRKTRLDDDTRKFLLTPLQQKGQTSKPKLGRSYNQGRFSFHSKNCEIIYLPNAGSEWGVILQSQDAKFSCCAHQRLKNNTDERKRLRMYWDMQTLEVTSDFTVINLMKMKNQRDEIERLCFLSSWKNGTYNYWKHNPNPHKPSLKKKLKVENFKALWTRENRANITRLIETSTRTFFLRSNLSFVPEKLTDEFWEKKRKEKIHKKNLKMEHRKTVENLKNMHQLENYDDMEKFVEAVKSENNFRGSLSCGLNIPKITDTVEDDNLEASFIEDCGTRIRGKETLKTIESYLPKGKNKKEIHAIFQIDIENCQVCLQDPISNGFIIARAKSLPLRQYQFDTAIRNNNEVSEKFSMKGDLNELELFTCTDEFIFKNPDKNNLDLPDSAFPDSDCLTPIITPTTLRMWYVYFKSLKSENSDEYETAKIETNLKYSVNNEESVNSLAIFLENLEIETDSKQIQILTNIMENLVLEIEPSTRAYARKLQQHKTKLKWMERTDDNVLKWEADIVKRKNELREMVGFLYSLQERQYKLQQNLSGISSSSTFYATEEVPILRRDLDILNRCILQQQKAVDEKSADCALRIKCLRNHKLQQVLEDNDIDEENNDDNSENGDFGDYDEDSISYCIRRAEILCENINWKLSDKNGKGSSIAECSLNDFMYVKNLFSDDKVKHRVELGWIELHDKIPSAVYKDFVLKPRNLQYRKSKRTLNSINNPILPQFNVLRVLAESRRPVGGIAIREYLEIKLDSLDIQVSRQFYHNIHEFFFPESDNLKETDNDGFTENITEIQPESDNEQRNNCHFYSQHSHLTDISRMDGKFDTMRDRANANISFVRVVIPEVDLNVSYHGAIKIKPVSLKLDPIEFRNELWTWQDLMNNIKENCTSQIFKMLYRGKLFSRKKSRVDKG